MKIRLVLLAVAASAVIAGSPVRAADAAAPAAQAPASAPVSPPANAPQRSDAELEKLAAPIALHPDPLISILLPAAAYPLEIVQAARFVKDTNNIPKIDQQAWDANVKAVAKVPELIAQLDADLEWTVELGAAFVEQPKELMDKIQNLRGKAKKAGTLQTTPQQIVTVTNVVVLQTNLTQVVTITNQIVQVQPANPEVIYVPTYPPTVYYPPPGYTYNPVAPLVSFGVAVGIGAIIANNCDWHGGAIWVGGGGVWVGGGGYGDVDVDIDIDNINIDRGDRGDRVDPRTGDRSRNPTATQQKWQPDQNRLRTSGAPATTQTRESRGWGGATTQPAQRGGTGTPAARPGTTPGAGTRPAAQPTYNFSERPATSGQQSRADITSQGTAARQQGPATRSSSPSRSGSGPSASPSVNRSTSPSSSAFGGVSSGSSARSASNRGSSSRGGGGGRGGGGRR